MQKIWLPSHRKTEGLALAETEVPEGQPFQAELEAIYRHVPMGLCFLDAGLRFRNINERLAEINGLPVKEHLGRTLREVLPDLADQLEPICRQVLATGLPIEEVPIRGSTPACPQIKRDWLASYFPVRDAKGQLTGISAQVVEVAERLMQETAQQWLAAVVESSGDAIISKDLDGVITSWNAAAERLYGYKAVEAIGKPITLLVPTDRLEEETRIMERLRRGEHIEPFETVRVAKDGRRIDVSLTISAVRDAKGKILGVSKIARDISERKNAEKFVQQAHEQLSHYTEDLEKQVIERTTRLEQTIQSLAGVCYHIAHDLRAPVRAIRGFTELLLEAHGFVLNGQGKEFVRRIVGACQRMDLLIQDLLAYGRLSHTELPAGWVNLEELTEAVLEEFGDEIKARDAFVQVVRPLPVVWANPTVMEQILSNLFSNALKYVGKGVTPRVRLWAEEREKFVRITVEDNGLGIAPAHHQRIFEIFERLHPDSDYPGTGIGLAIVQKGMERMQGRVMVESELGMGSRFIIELPKPESKD